VWFRIESMGSGPSAAATQVLKATESQAFSKRSFSSSFGILLPCLILIAVVLVPYNRVIHNNFIRYDDDTYITDNAYVKAGLTWKTVKWAFTTYDVSNWHPLTWISHALDVQLFSLNPAGHHYVSVLLHAINAVLLFFLLQNATGFRWRSLMVAALFALHPVNVESVAWAAERKNVLSMMFFLLALYAYNGYSRRPGVARYMAVVSAFALALMCKPQVITFPFLLLLWDYWPLSRFGVDAAGRCGRSAGIWRLVIEKLPLLVMSAASAWVTVQAQRGGGAVKSLSEYSPLLRLETAVIAYVDYLGKAIWPARLAGLYPHAIKPYPAWQVGSALLLLVTITACVVRAREQRYLAVGWFWFLGSLVPMLGLVQVGFQSMADRYAYIPFLGLFVMVVWLAADAAKARHESARWLAIPAVSCLLLLGVLTYRQIGYWHDTQSLWLHALESTRDNYLAEDNLGELLFSQGKTEEAAEHFRAALAIRPDDMSAILNLGAYEYHHGNLTAAIQRYRMVTSRSADEGLRATAYGSLGFAYRQTGQQTEARQCFETALQLRPNSARVLVGLGLIAQGGGNMAEAIRLYSLAAAVQSTDVVDLLLAQALQQGGHSAEAQTIYKRVAQSPNLPEAQQAVQSLLAGK
jgi:tetratricopeptide (TPR) repeat protein